jgi:hypothetical protein
MMPTELSPIQTRTPFLLTLLMDFAPSHQDVQEINGFSDGVFPAAGVSLAALGTIQSRSGHMMILLGIASVAGGLSAVLLLLSVGLSPRALW